MLGTEVGRRVAAPIDVLWSTIAAFGAYPGIVGSYVSVEYLTPQTGDLGASWRQTRSVFGREHTQVLRILAWDPPFGLETAAQESGAHYRTIYRLAEIAGATDIRVRFEVEATNVVGNLFQRLLGRRLMASTRAAMQRDLEDLAAAAERTAQVG